MRLTSSNCLVVSRRNLLALLAKLDGHPPNSACTLVGGTHAPGFILKAEPDEIHYANRTPKGLHRDTELRVRSNVETT